MFHDVEYFILFEFFAFHHLFQIAIFTKLRDDVQTVFGRKDIFELDYVWVVESFKEINLGKDGVLEIFIVGESGEIDFFDGNFLFALALHALIDFSVDSFAETFGSLI